MARDRSFTEQGLHWSSIWGGLFVATGVFVLLDLLGMAIGLGVLDPGRASSVQNVGIGTAVWAGIVQIVALFAGAFVMARSSDFIHRFRSVAHGAVLWGLATLLAMVLGFAMIGSALNAGATALSAGARSAPQVIESAAPALGLDQTAWFAPINEELRRQGKPELTPAEIQATTQAVAQSGRFDRAGVAQALADHTRMSRADAEQVAAQLEARMSQAGQQVAATAEDVSDAASGAFWGLFLATLLGLAASLLGSLAGMRSRDRFDGRREVVSTTSATEPPPIVAPREVYP